MIVKALKIPVRYQGVTHPAGQVFEMEEAHFNGKIVIEVTAEEEEGMAKYVKQRETIAQTPTEEETDYTTYSETELKKVKNDDLKGFLDSRGVEYKTDAIKEDYINAILGK
ncbi:hypothetical protein FQ085_11620 [Planococcus sp. ANT_H30]|uniref:hypothetical protein n=1 Tax=Planococcus sp. ANT_H30 TaxID=2597347 RepID=UPI0011EC809A|nr:hypothetical protein [Planococcus sp. ANT_H30]KAA0956635.1 hypothetical protein FQ085_11620 [Planococcus sp. ANT_H30]